MTGMSRLEIASNASRPTPGQANTLSVRTAPPSKQPGLQADHRDDRNQRVAQRVLEHDRVARRALWRGRSGCSRCRRPRAWPLRVILATIASGIVPSVRAGSTRCQSPSSAARHVPGQQRVEHDQVRARRNRVAQRDPAGDREEVEADVRGQHGQQIDQHPAEPKDRDRDAYQHGAHRERVDGAPRAHRGERRRPGCRPGWRPAWRRASARPSPEMRRRVFARPVACRRSNGPRSPWASAVEVRAQLNPPRPIEAVLVRQRAISAGWRAGPSRIAIGSPGIEVHEREADERDREQHQHRAARSASAMKRATGLRSSKQAPAGAHAATEARRLPRTDRTTARREVVAVVLQKLGEARRAPRAGGRARRSAPAGVPGTPSACGGDAGAP